MWQLSGYVSEGFDGYAKIVVEKTDNNGAFIIPFWINLKPWKIGSRVDDLAPKIVIYKPGYDLYWSHKLMRIGYPNDTVMTTGEKCAMINKYSIIPARLNPISTDGELWNIYMKFRSEANLSTDDYTARQLTKIFDAIRRGLMDLPKENNRSRNDISSDMKQYER